MAYCHPPIPSLSVPSPSPSPLSSCHPFCHQSVFLKISLRLTFSLLPHPFTSFWALASKICSAYHHGTVLQTHILNDAPSQVKECQHPQGPTGALSPSSTHWCLELRPVSGSLLRTSLPGIIIFSPPRICTLPSINGHPAHSLIYRSPLPAYQRCPSLRWNTTILCWVKFT